MTQAQKTMKLYKEGYQWEAYKSYQSDESAVNPSMTILQFIGKMEEMIQLDNEMNRTYKLEILQD